MNESVYSVIEGVVFSDVEIRRMDLFNFVSKFVFSNVSRGVVCFLIGVNLVLDVIRLISIFLMECFV